MFQHGLSGRIATAAVALLRFAGAIVLGGPVFVTYTSAYNLRVALPATAQTYTACRDALKWVISLANAFLSGAPIRKLLAVLPRLVNHIEKRNPAGMNTVRFIQAAHEAKIPWQQLVNNVHQFGWGSRAKLLDSSFTGETPTISARIARDKLSTARMLRLVQIPVPEHALARDPEHAVGLARSLGYPVVVKPADQDGGRGVCVGLRNDDAVRRGYAKASEFSGRVLVEKHFDGNDYRVQVHAGEAYWVVHRMPGGVVGDGSLTVEQLLAITNADPRRGEPGASKLLVRIQLDDEALELLAEQGLAPAAVPEMNRFVRLRRAANVASGGVPVPVLDQAHPDNLALAVRAARVLRLDLAGVDLLMPDIRKSWLDLGAVICEVNAQPQLSPHLPAIILKRLVRGDGRVPLVLVLGTEVGTDWHGELFEALAAGGKSVGVASPKGTTIGGQRTCGPCDSYQATRSLLADPTVDAAVVVVADEQMMTTAAPVDRIDVLVLDGPLTPTSDPQAWQRWESLALMLAVRSARVLVNQDSVEWLAISKRWSTKNISALAPAEFVAALKQTSLEVHT